MTSPLLALFVRSLREDSRQKLTYFARSGLVVVILLFLFGTQGRMGWANAPGLAFFETVIGIDFCFVILAGVSFFSSAISEEKEEMTLGLLRMTNLNPLSILLGKSTSRLCAAILLFTAQVPFTLLAITLGGVSLHQILAAYVAVAAFLVFVSNLALLGSVLFRRTSTAGLFTGVALFFFFGFFVIAAATLRLPVALGLLTTSSEWVTSFERFATFLEQASPFFRLDRIFSTGFRESAFSFQVWSNCLLGAFFFLLAWAVFEYFCGEQKETAPTRTGAGRTRGRRSSLSAGRTWRRALAWKDFYFLAGGKLWLIVKFIIYGAPLAVALVWPGRLGGRPTWEEFGGATFGLMTAFLCVELAFAAGSIFRVEHQGQTLSSLAMLPQGVRRIAYEKLLGILPSLAAAGIYLLCSIPLIAKSVVNTIESDFSTVEIFAGFVVQGVFFLHLVAYLSLRIKRGAIPVAIGTHVLILIFFGMSTAFIPGGESKWILCNIVTFGVAISLHINIGQRLADLAAEE